MYIPRASLCPLPSSVLGTRGWTSISVCHWLGSVPGLVFPLDGAEGGLVVDLFWEISPYSPTLHPFPNHKHGADRAKREQHGKERKALPQGQAREVTTSSGDCPSDVLRVWKDGAPRGSRSRRQSRTAVPRSPHHVASRFCVGLSLGRFVSSLQVLGFIVHLDCRGSFPGGDSSKESMCRRHMWFWHVCQREGGGGLGSLGQTSALKTF